MGPVEDIIPEMESGEQEDARLVSARSDYPVTLKLGWIVLLSLSSPHLSHNPLRLIH